MKFGFIFNFPTEKIGFRWPNELHQNTIWWEIDSILEYNKRANKRIVINPQIAKLIPFPFNNFFDLLFFNWQLKIQIWTLRVERICGKRERIEFKHNNLFVRGDDSILYFFRIQLFRTSVNFSEILNFRSVWPPRF